MYAVVQTGGKQYRVSEGDVISVEKLNAEVGEVVKLDQVLVVSEDGKLTVGTPCIQGAAVAAEVLENGKGKKVVIFKYKAKKDYRCKKGHRQPFTKLQIKEISLTGEFKAAPAPAKEEAAVSLPNLKAMKKAELIAFAEANGVELNPKATNADMIAAIEAALK